MQLNYFALVNPERKALCLRFLTLFGDRSRLMLRINPHTSASSATRYYTGNLSRQEYYSEKHLRLGEWGGEGAAKLGLVGPVTADAFAALASNLHPLTRERLTVRQKSNRTVGYDFTFDTPKSISIAYAINRDERLAQAVRQAVFSTMALIEADAATRVRVNRRDENRPTGNLVWAGFMHETTRPVDGVPDPQLHWHCFVFNATEDPIEHRWKAGQFRELKRNAPYYQAVFHSTLASLLRERGYEIEARGLEFELAGFSDELIARFSRRTKQIEDAARKRGITNPVTKSLLGAQTREAKRGDTSYDDLHAEWRSRLTPDDLQQIRRHLDPKPLPGVARTLDPTHIADAIHYAKTYCFERQSVANETELVTAALRYSMGETKPEDIRRAIKSDPTFIRAHEGERVLLTTADILAEERDLVDWVRKGHRALRPLAPGSQLPVTQLPADLRAAVRHILDSTDRVTGIHGRAGTGKTTLMKTAIAALEESGHRVVVLAPTADAARGTLREHAFPNSNTVEHLLSNLTAQEDATNAVLWIDEAGLLSLRDLTRLSKLADKINARIILTGDTGQHRSVRRGDALRTLIEHADLSLADLREIRRQSGEYKEAVEATADNKLARAFEILDRMGAIIEDSTPDRHAHIASLYVEHRSRGDSVLVVSPTHSEARKVTHLLRDHLKDRGELADERLVPQLRRVDLRDADIRRPSEYKPGMIIEMVKHAPGHESGKRFVVASVVDGEVFVQHADGARRSFDVSAWSDRFHIFNQAEVPVATGDRIRITKNGYDQSRLPLNNGSLHTVVGFTPAGDILLGDGRVVERSFAHIEHGYVTTSHSAQSKTVKHVIVAEGSESFPAASREQFYVSVSRGQISATIVTDDKEALLESVRQSSQRTAALDLDTRIQPKPSPSLEPSSAVLGLLREPSPVLVDDRKYERIARKPSL